VPDVSEVVEVGSDVAVFEDVTLDVMEPYDPPPEVLPEVTEVVTAGVILGLLGT